MVEAEAALNIKKLISILHRRRPANPSSENYQAILLGEVSGNWIAPELFAAKREKAGSEEEKNQPFIKVFPKAYSGKLPFGIYSHQQI